MVAGGTLLIGCELDGILGLEVPAENFYLMAAGLIIIPTGLALHKAREVVMRRRAFEPRYIPPTLELLSKS